MSEVPRARRRLRMRTGCLVAMGSGVYRLRGRRTLAVRKKLGNVPPTTHVYPHMQTKTVDSRKNASSCPILAAIWRLLNG